MKQRKCRIYCLVITGLLFTACTASTAQPNTPPVTPVNINTVQPSPLIPVHSFPSSWKMIDQPTSLESGFLLVVYAMKITGQETTIISSVMGPEAGKLNEPATLVQIKDDVGVAKLVSKNSLAQLGPIRFWAMRFEPRTIGAIDLYLQINQDSGKADIYNRLVAKFAEPPEDLSVYDIRTYLIGIPQTFEHKGYRTSFEGWIPPPKPMSSATPEIPVGATITNKATLRIDEIASNQTYYLFILFFSNGEISGVLNK